MTEMTEMTVMTVMTEITKLTEMTEITQLTEMTEMTIVIVTSTKCHKLLNFTKNKMFQSNKQFSVLKFVTQSMLQIENLQN